MSAALAGAEMEHLHLQLYLYTPPSPTFHYRHRSKFTSINVIVPPLVERDARVRNAAISLARQNSNWRHAATTECRP